MRVAEDEGLTLGCFSLVIADIECFRCFLRSMFSVCLPGYRIVNIVWVGEGPRGGKKRSIGSRNIRRMVGMQI